MKLMNIKVSDLKKAASDTEALKEIKAHYLPDMSEEEFNEGMKRIAARASEFIEKFGDMDGNEMMKNINGGHLK